MYIIKRRKPNMRDYSKGKIYTVRCRTDDTLIYVGSTIETLSKRWGGHKGDSKRSNMLLYQAINGDWDNWYIELYELYPCNSREELVRKEGKIIRLMGTLNFVIAGRTLNEYNEDNKEHRIEVCKKWVKNNREYINEKRNQKMTCSCGCIINISSKGRHEKRKIHLDKINNIV